jgi:hypothetical protein
MSLFRVYEVGSESCQILISAVSEVVKYGSLGFNGRIEIAM